MDLSHLPANAPGALYFSVGVGIATYLILYVYNYFIRPFVRWTRKKRSPND